MKLWFFARTEQAEYLYIRVTDYYCTEIPLSTIQINKLPIFKVKSFMFNDFAAKFPDGLYSSKVIIKGGKYCFKQGEEIALKESSFFLKDIFKKMPVINDAMAKLDIVKACHKKWEMEDKE